MLFRWLLLWLCLRRVFADDASVLLEFRAALHDPSGVLSGWGSQSTNFCQWYGVSCNDRNNVESLRIHLWHSSNATGAPENSIAVLATLGELRELTSLDVSKCNLTGSITSDLIERFRFLEELTVSDNQLNGSIPDSLGNLANLIWIDLSENYLSGDIPQSLGHLSSLRYLYLFDNFLTGSIPASLANTSLITLDLERNNLSGLIPSALGNLNPTLMFLYLADNRLEGFSMPSPSFSNFTLLRGLTLSRNKMGGRIPVALASMGSLRALFLDGNGFKGPILPEFGNMIFCRFLLLSDNQLSGPIPSNLSGMASIVSNTYLDASNNLLEGLVPPAMLLWGSFFGSINLSRNRLSSLPTEVCLPRLGNLDLSFNQIRGTLPAIAPGGICNLGSLQFLSLNDNELEGDISNLVANNSNLQFVNVRNNKLGGRFPLSLLELPILRVLSLAHNQFQGPIPNGITNSSQLQVLDLSGNSFSGSIPENVSGLLAFQEDESSSENYYQNTTLYQVEVSVQLKGNEVVLTQILKAQTMMDLSSNSITGKIPGELGSLVGMRYLNLSHNQIQGDIPATLADISSLESLDLSYNNLTGGIPAQFGTLHQLSEMVVAHNNLSGYIPTGGQFDRFPDTDFEGNPFVRFQCGVNLPHKCAPPPSGNEDPTPSADQPEAGLEQYVSLEAVGSGFVVGFLTVLAFFIYSTRGWSYLTYARGSNSSNPRPVKYGFFTSPL